MIENEKQRRLDEAAKTKQAQEETNEVPETVQPHSEGVSTNIESQTDNSGEQEPQEI